MDIPKTFPERRKNKRFRLKDLAFAVMYYSPNRIGQITDISKSGLAIRYVKNEECSGQLNELDILKPDFSPFIDKIKAKSISDIEIIDKTLFGSIEFRRCGIHFENLSSNQISQLENFIQNSTSTEGLHEAI